MAKETKLSRPASIKDYLIALKMYATQAYPGNGGTDWNAWLKAALDSQVGGHFGGGSNNFNGGGAGGVFTPAKDYTHIGTFNQAFDQAVKDGEDYFIYGEKLYNTEKEGNPIKELNNRIAGSSKERAKLKKKDPYLYYPNLVGRFKHNISTVGKTVPFHKSGKKLLKK